MNWRDHWNTFPNSVGEDDFLRQVGKTVGGRAVPEATLDTMRDDIAAALALGPLDYLLDLCCGNGLLTARCASRCAGVTGVDFSAPLLAVARLHFGRGNVEYVQADVRDLPKSVRDKAHSKVVMYEAIQHLAPGELQRLLANLSQSASGHAPVLFGSVPDRDRIWNFYDTAERRAEYHRRVEEGTEAIGYWWSVAELQDLGAQFGYGVAIRSPSPSLHGAHYRLDALFTPFSRDV